jgi:hypothetical protein
LRGYLLASLQKAGAAAIVVHHTPKLNNRDTTKWSTQTFMYSGHGSAEWTNARRGVITIDNTYSSRVYQFRIAKRGSQSGWEESNGKYLRYFSHAPKNMPMHWIPSTEEEIAESQQACGFTDQDVLNVLSEEEPEKTGADIRSKLEKNGLKFTTSQLDDAVKRLIGKNKLLKAGHKYILAKVMKKAAKANEKAAEAEKQAEIVFGIIQAAMPIGIGSTHELNDAAPFGKDTVTSAVETLLDQKRICIEITKQGIIEKHRYFTLLPAAAAE